MGNGHTCGEAARLTMTDYSTGQFGTSDAPGNCPDCGAIWDKNERLHTGDDKGIGGWEDWMHCKACGCETFYPVTHATPCRALLRCWAGWELLHIARHGGCLGYNLPLR